MKKAMNHLKTEEKWIPKDYERQVHFHVPRTWNHTTFLACICGDGHFLHPCIVTKRKTGEAELLAHGLTSAHLYLAELTLSLSMFAPAITKTRNENLDGFQPIYQNIFWNNVWSWIQVIFFTSHSSHWTQPLDQQFFRIKP